MHFSIKVGPTHLNKEIVEFICYPTYDHLLLHCYHEKKNLGKA